MFMLKRQIIREFLPKYMPRMVLAGQGQGGDNGDLTSINKQDFSRGYFNLQEAATDEVANILAFRKQPV